MTRSLTAIFSSTLLWGLCLQGIEFRVEGRGVVLELRKPRVSISAESASGGMEMEEITFRGVIACLKNPVGILDIRARTAWVERRAGEEVLKLAGNVRAGYEPVGEGPAAPSVLEAREVVLTEGKIEGSGDVRLVTEVSGRLEAEAEKFTFDKDGTVFLKGGVETTYSREKAIITVAGPLMKVMRKERLLEVQFPGGFAGRDGTYQFRGAEGVLRLSSKEGRWEPASFSASGAAVMGPSFEMQAQRLASPVLAGAGCWEASGDARLEYGGLKVTAGDITMERRENEAVQITARPAKVDEPVRLGVTGSSGSRTVMLVPAAVTAVVSKGSTAVAVPENKEIEITAAGLKAAYKGRGGRLVLEGGGGVDFSGEEGRMRLDIDGVGHTAVFGQITARLEREPVRSGYVFMQGSGTPAVFTVERRGVNLVIRAAAIRLTEEQCECWGAPVEVETGRGTLKCASLTAVKSGEEITARAIGPLSYTDGAEEVNFSAMTLMAVLDGENRLKTAEASGGVRLAGPDLLLEGERVVKNAEGRYTMFGTPVILKKDGGTTLAAGNKVEYDAKSGRIKPEGDEIRVE